MIKLQLKTKLASVHSEQAFAREPRGSIYVKGTQYIVEELGRAGYSIEDHEAYAAWCYVSHKLSVAWLYPEHRDVVTDLLDHAVEPVK